MSSFWRGSCVNSTNEQWHKSHRMTGAYVQACARIPRPWPAEGVKGAGRSSIPHQPSVPNSETAENPKTVCIPGSCASDPNLIQS